MQSHGIFLNLNIRKDRTVKYVYTVTKKTNNNNKLS